MVESNRERSCLQRLVKGRMVEVRWCLYAPICACFCRYCRHHFCRCSTLRSYMYVTGTRFYVFSHLRTCTQICPFTHAYISMISLNTTYAHTCTSLCTGNCFSCNQGHLLINVIAPIFNWILFARERRSHLANNSDDIVRFPLQNTLLLHIGSDGLESKAVSTGKTIKPR